MHNFVNEVLASSGTCIFSVGQAGFIIKSSSGHLIAIDLYLSNCVERIEGNQGFKRLLPQILEAKDLNFTAIICTHAHADHFDIDAIPEIVSSGAKLFCSVGCEALVHQLQMEYYSNRITYVSPGDEVKIEDFQITFVNCDHGKSAPDAVGVVVKVDHRTIYETGDTCLRIDRISEIPNSLDVLIAPINGMYGNMNATDVVALSEELKPSITIPCHYGMFASHGGDLKKFYDMATEKRIHFLIMRQGECYKIKNMHSCI